MNISAGKEQSVWINARGGVASIPFGPDLPVSGIDISLSVKADDVPRLFANVNLNMPELDDISGQTHLHGSADHLIFDGINIQMRDPGGVTAGISGNFLLDSRENRGSLGTYDLSVKVEAESIASFRGLLDAETLPDLKPVKASVQVTGTTEIMSLEDILIQAGHEDHINFAWRGSIGKISFNSDRPVSDVAIFSTFQAKSISLLSPYVGISVPDIGPLSGKANIVDRTDGYGVDHLEAIIGEKGGQLLKTTGSVEYIMRGSDVVFEGINLRVEVPGLDSSIIAGHLGKKELDLGKISGGFALSGSPEDFAIGDVRLESAAPGGLELSMQGGVRHIRLKGDRGPSS
jgi:hypothetical protein